MARPKRWELLLRASQQEALLAVSLFNDPSRDRALEGFIIHMHIAWLYAFQAKWLRAGKNYHVRLSERPRRYKQINGERMSQPLEWFVKQEYPQSNSAVRANLEFFIALRNKIEHRHTGTDEALRTVVNGECHSMLLNYEEFITDFAGQKHSLAHRLHFPVFIGGFTDQGKSDLLKLTKTLPKDLHTFLAEYDAGLDEGVSRDPRYCMRLTVLLESGNRKGDLSLQFVNYNNLSPEQKKAAEEIAAQGGLVITKTKTQSVANADKLKPGQIAQRVEDAILFRFRPYEMSCFWRKHGVRPPAGDVDPKNTKSEWCVYDTAHGDYLYTEACAKWLIKKCSTEKGFREATGLEPRLKQGS
ncbi:DUF3644 domain-containing protein [Mycobacterium sp. M1]|uniref:DUF3644 domain-containing protein n=1 Tax=Mycolicibacter acidiphilus TaxID=2835306 RepID=A0ABS5RLP7_9MYCO|nr:DUF3644 domain-containing protein [Mycolicibacter acidiphilus]MBS9535094.1 DUF3644 domain-containing protein [Mycolicibacter acidiphilus]